MNFSSFVGNDEVKKRLSDYFVNGRLPHCIILQGEDGTGKRTLSKLIASAAVCRSDAFSAPCGVCPACIRAKAGTHPDIKITVGSGVSGQISVESVKNIIEDAYLRPEESSHSVYLIFSGSVMSEAVQNKLLKIIEEPPEGVIFIITIKSAETLLPTVRSRAGIFTLKAPEKEAAVGYLTEKFPELESEAIENAVNAFSGNIGKAEAFFSEKGAAPSVDAAIEVCRIFYKNDEHALLKALQPFSKDRQRLTELLNNMMGIFRDACALKSGSDKLISVDRDAAENMSRMLKMSQLMLLPGICRKYIDLTAKNANQALLITCFASEIRKAVSK